jgi:hypothetical protein
MSLTPLTSDRVVEILIACESEIRALGVERLALFGSVLHDTAGPDSDVDFLVARDGAKTFDRFLALRTPGNTPRPARTVTTEALSPFIGTPRPGRSQDVLRAA